MQGPIEACALQHPTEHHPESSPSVASLGPLATTTCSGRPHLHRGFPELASQQKSARCSPTRICASQRGQDPHLLRRLQLLVLFEARAPVPRHESCGLQSTPPTCGYHSTSSNREHDVGFRSQSVNSQFLMEQRRPRHPRPKKCCIESLLGGGPPQPNRSNCSLLLDMTNPRCLEVTPSCFVRCGTHPDAREGLIQPTTHREASERPWLVSCGDVW